MNTSRTSSVSPPSSAKARARPSGSELEHRTFVSQSVTENGAPRVLVDTASLKLRFWESSRLSASAGCNSLESTYQISDGAFVLGEAAATMRGCDQVLHAQDDWYFSFLGSSPAITVEADTLVLEGDGTRIEYLDGKVAGL